MKLYYHPASPNARRVIAVAEHLRIPLEMKLVDMFKGEQDQPEYLRLNPNGMVPLLEDGDFRLFESNAIMQYIAEKSGDTSLWPKELKARADITRWQFWAVAHLGPQTSKMVVENMFKPFRGGQPDAAVVKDAEESFHFFAAILNHHLEGRAWLTGVDVTLADFSVATHFSYAIPGKFPMQEYKHIRAWLDRMDQIDAWKKSAPRM
jgi:glutathione S-transferase